MHAMPDFRKPTLAVVIAFCDSTPDDPMPRPYVVAQPAQENGKHELWNMPVEPEMTTLDIFGQFAEAYLLEPNEADRPSLAPLARLETETHLVRVFGASRLFRWQEFRRLDDKELVPFTSARKQPIWTAMTLRAVETAFRSAGMKAILAHERLVRKGRLHAMRMQAH